MPDPVSAPAVWLTTASTITPTPAALQALTMRWNSARVPSLDSSL
ncbi:Uncharacterised protein [Mycobacteroides abscessus]|nr:Uncharacterised protein [Mycobacteroides abscessus]